MVNMIELSKKQNQSSHSFKHTTVSIEEIIKKEYRIEASVFGLEGRQAREDLENCRWNIVSLGDKFIENSFYGLRSKRIYVDKDNKDSIGFLGSSEMLSIQPKPVKFLLKKDGLTVSKGSILLSRSGTIGNVAYVSSTLEKYAISEHAIRIYCYDHPGYVYTFLKSKIGRALVESNTFGAVISQIEPEHLNNIPIPNPSSIVKQKIHNLIEKSFKLRDDSNDLMDESQNLLKHALKLPDIKKLKIKSKGFDKGSAILNYSVSVNKLNNRLDGSYHLPVVQEIEAHLKRYASEVTNVRDDRISKTVILPGRFKRIYVGKDSGVTFFGGKQISELDPSNKKYLSLVHHGDRIKTQLTLHENMIMITCSGTVGKVAIVPEHWEGWTANQHIIRIIPRNSNVAGYLYAWLSSDYAYQLIIRYTYGAVVDEIDDRQISAISIPLCKNLEIQNQINKNVLDANKMRTKAYQLEQEALRIMNDEVIYSSS